MANTYIYVHGCARSLNFPSLAGAKIHGEGLAGAGQSQLGNLGDLLFVACPGRALAVAMVVVMVVALVWPGASNTQRNVLARHLPSHCETLASLGLRLVKISDICIYGFPQTGVSSTRNDYFSTLGISVAFWSSEAVVSCARNAHFLKNAGK